MNTLRRMTYGAAAALLSLCTLHAQETDSDSVAVINVSDTFNRSTGESITFALPQKQQRVSAYQGKFSAVFGEELPSAYARCAEVAINLWRNYIVADSTVILKFDFDESGDLTENVKIDVKYKRKDGVAWPQALYYQNNLRPNDSEDAVITINGDVDWDTSLYQSSDDTRPNLTTALIRAIAVSLGYGTSIVKKRVSNNCPYSPLGVYSPFDKLIFACDSTYMKDLRQASTALLDFMEGTECRAIYAYTADDAHKLYSPESFEPGRSLVYMHGSNTLMSANISNGDIFLQIDATTLQLLEQIGWHLTHSGPVTITSEEIGLTGIASAYSQHQFTLDNTSGSAITAGQWTFALPDSEGTYQVVKSQAGSEPFTIEAITNPEQYQININGDILGELTYECVIDGSPVHTTYYVSLELAPIITQYGIISDMPATASGFYDVEIEVEYRGSDRLVVYVEREFSPAINVYTYYEPFYATFTVINVQPQFYTWVDITASNAHGTTTETVEIPPLDGSASRAGCRAATLPQEITGIDVINLNGERVATVSDIAELHSLTPGIYVLKVYNESSIVKTIKYAKR